MSKYFHVESLTTEVKKLTTQPFVVIPVRDDVTIGTCQRVIVTCANRLNIPIKMHSAKAITSKDKVMTLIIVESKFDNDLGE